MVGDRMLITGATGLVGTRLTQQAVFLGYRVRAMVRPTSDRTRLQELGVEIVEADLDVPFSLPQVVRGVDVVVHAAALVGDWGPVERYRAINVLALEHLLAAVEHEGRLRRWVQISSLGVYPARDHFGTDESQPIDLSGLDGYTRSKAEAEILLRRHQQQHQLPAVVLRPGFLYGPGDRHLLPPLAARISTGRMRLIGSGMRLLNNTCVDNLVDAILLAVEKEEAVGETFNIRDPRLVTRREFVDTIADYLGVPHPPTVPLALGRGLAVFIDSLARFRGRRDPPLLTRARLKFLTLNLDFSIAKAGEKLGYQPRIDFQEGIHEALVWAHRAGHYDPPSIGWLSSSEMLP